MPFNTLDEQEEYTSRMVQPEDDFGHEPQVTMWDADTPEGAVAEGDVLIIDPAYFFPEFSEQKPPEHAMIGMSVHYVARGSLDGVFPPVDRACIIAGIDSTHPWTIQGVVLNPQGIFFDELEHDPDGSPGSWHYPWENLDDGGADEDGGTDDDRDLGIPDFSDD